MRVTPKSSRDAVTGLYAAADGTLSLAVRVAAPPDKGKANRAVIATIAEAAGMPKTSFSIAGGETDRNKVLLVTGNPAGLEALIALNMNTGKES